MWTIQGKGNEISAPMHFSWRDAVKSLPFLLFKYFSLVIFKINNKKNNNHSNNNNNNNCGEDPGPTEVLEHHFIFILEQYKST